ncbi:hypothetical protein ABFX02_11G077900 [Erythranthe guttata]
MYSNTMNKYLLQTFLISSFIVQTMSVCFWGAHVKVKVVDNLPPNSPQLFMHCASADDDLGNHTLTNGQDFHFKFCFNGRTLFFCHLWWNGKQRAFDVYNSRTCQDNKGICYWEARSDGIYHSEDNPPNDAYKVYDWQ